MTKSEFFIIGDSHSGVLAEYAKRKGLRFRGGMVGNGAHFSTSFFSVKENRLLLTEPKVAGRRQANHTFVPKEFDITPYEELLLFDGPILTTIGFHSHKAGATISRALENSGMTIEQLSTSEINLLIENCYHHCVEFYKLLQRYNKTVYFTCISPALRVPLFRESQTYMIKTASSLGANFIDVISHTYNGDLSNPEYHRVKVKPDGSKKLDMHGNDKWCELVFSEFNKMLLNNNI